MKKIPLLIGWLFWAFAFQAGAQMVIVQQNDFSKGTDGWFFWTSDSAQANFTAGTGQAIVQVVKPGLNAWSAGLSDPGINIAMGRIYKVEFEASATPAINVVSGILLNQIPWTSYSGSRIFALTGENNKYSYTFTMPMQTDTQAVLQMMFGGQTSSTITIDNVIIYDMGKDSSVITFPDTLKDTIVNRDMDSCTVFAYAQLMLEEYDQEVLTLQPDINIMNFTQWGTKGLKQEDYNFTLIKQGHHYNILAGGGITTIIVKDQFASEAEFRDIATRDANNELVSWDAVQGLAPNTYRGTLANPKYRKYLIDICKIQIDGGVDGIFFDETNSSFLGGPARNWTNNEGFDDYTIKDFNRYLIEKYPDYTEQDWKAKFRMADSNIIKKDVSPDDLSNNFNYRKYLQANGWSGSTWNKDTPFEPGNPLAPEWGRQTGNRIYNDGTFTSSYLKKYLKEIFDSVRMYGIEKYGKKIFMTGNGILPGVDYNTVGMYGDNPEGYDYIPVTNGSLDGSVSLMSQFQNLYKRSRETSGNVPLAFCFDAFSPKTNDYFALPLEQKKDLWQIYTAEAYASGCYYAFFLSASIPGIPKAKDLGVLDFMTQYTQYYKKNSSFYHHNEYSDKSVEISLPNIAYNLMEQKTNNRYVLHLINHNYNTGILSQKKFQVTVALDSPPAKVYALSPDFEGEKEIRYTYDGSKLILNIDSLNYYTILSIQTSQVTYTGKPLTQETGQCYVYPQPAGNKATLVYTLPEPADVTITIYNMHAVMMAEMHDSNVNTERNTQELSLSGFAPGMYFYSIKARAVSGKDIPFTTGKLLIEK